MQHYQNNVYKKTESQQITTVLVIFLRRKVHVTSFCLIC
jgi:hypothetical protein